MFAVYDTHDGKFPQKAPVPFKELHGQAAWQMYNHALAVYREAFDFSGDYYPGINAATLSLLCGKADESRRIESIPGYPGAPQRGRSSG